MQRELRLRRSADFDRVRAGGRSYHHALLTLVIAPNQHAHNRYGFVASRRVGSAVARNRARRRLREALRRLHTHLKVGYDMIFLARGAVLEAQTAQITEALTRLMVNAKVWEPEQHETPP